MRLVEQAERLPVNRPGSDKTWTERVLDEWKQTVESAGHANGAGVAFTT